MNDRRIVAGALALLAFWAAPIDARNTSGATWARNVDRVESVRAVKRLQYALALHVEAGEWDAAARLFDRSGVLDNGDGTPALTGRAQIAAAWRTTLGRGRNGSAPRTIHADYYMAPIVTLSDDGRTARGRWHMIRMAGGANAGADWLGGIWENVYVRSAAGWGLSRATFRPYMIGGYRDGWHGATPKLPMMPYHFSPDEIGRPVTTAPAGSVRAGGTIAARVRALNDEAAVRNLQNAYGFYVDRKMWDDVVDLFEPTGSLGLVGLGAYRGAASIRRGLEREGPQGLRYGEMNDHLQIDVVVDIAADGHSARARGLDLGMIGRNEAGAFWTLTRFDNRFVKANGRWRIAAMRLEPRLRTSYALGWGQSWLDEPVPDRYHAPDTTEVVLPRPFALDQATRPRSGRAFASVANALEAAAAYDAIENLAGAYGQYVDDGQWDALGSIFAAQGERDSAGGGFIRSRAKIAAFSKARYGAYNPKRLWANFHIRTQPVIDIAADATHAQSRTRLFQFIIGAADAPPARYDTGMMMTGSYEDDIVIENGVWKNQRVDLDHLLYTLDYRHGWTRIPEGTGKLLDPALSAEAARQFDVPGKGDTYPPFPKVGHMWFHYRNPVSGREPPYLMPKYDLPEP